MCAWPDSFICIAFYFCIGRRTSFVDSEAISSLYHCTVYCNSLLATLNARNEIRSDSINDVSLSLQSRSAHRRTTHSTLGAPLQVGHLSESGEHGLIIISEHAEQYRHQDRHHTWVHLGRGKQCVQRPGFQLTDGWLAIPQWREGSSRGCMS